MRRSAYRRAAAPSGGNRRLLAVGAVIAALGAVVAFTTISNAATNDTPAGSGAGKVVNGQVILTDTCVDSKLPLHDGFQNGNRCVATEFGEVASENNNTTLLITSAPRQVTVNTPFTLKVSTRNLIRDRFLAAGKGGYYVESSVLQDGIERGHFHTACRMLTSTKEAPDPAPVPAFFVATEDQKGGKTPDVVTIQVPGMPTIGTAQCASWAGDGSHRVPMMQRANQTPAIDAVRIQVRAAGGNNGGGGNTGGGNNGGGGNTGGGNNGGGGNTGGGNTGGGNTGGGNNNGGGATTPPTTAPTTAATTAPANPATTKPTQPTVKDVITPKATPTTQKPATTTTKKAETAPKTTAPKETEKPASTNTEDSDSTTTDSSSSDDATDNTQSDDTPAAKPKASKSTEAAAAGDYTYTNDDGVVNSGEKPPTKDQVAAQTTNEKSSGVLALTGNNTVAFLGGAVVLMLAGLVVMAFTRRRRPGTPWE
ncbi:hypothetical protein ODJ79_32985 [Actinoplanes sp. KI2]|uniref:hypothetical protein n=1 Tax=Actinoplanes sp. KI2 TaxID=2983315 RepID=UPI0021D5C7AF|nr:hypothetical protein [Actinoplanes sp. KI2]MCU7728553.1 hypothetical protein [Actinoplanes sp. KI2]